MQENKNLVQEALIQMKNVEEAIAENAKGILASTMKEEINQLVKESLSEQDDEEEVELDVDADDVDLDVDADVDTDNMDDMDMELDMDMDSEESPIDLTDASDEEILKVFKAMGEEDGIIVKKDGDDVHLTDNNSDVEYLVKLGESEEDTNLDETMNVDEIDEMDVNSVIDAIFNKDGDASDIEVDQEEDEMFEEDEVMYEIEFDEQEEEMDDEEMYESDMDEIDEEEMDEESNLDEEEEMDEEEMDESDMEQMYEEDDEDLDESYNPRLAVREGKSTVKPKGVGIGSGPKFTYKDKAKGGFDEKKKEGPKSVGTGKAKFEYKKGENMESKSKVVKAETKEGDYGMNKGDKSKTHKGDKDYTTKKGDTLKRKAFEKEETKEAARTLGMGSDFRKGGLPKPRAHSKFNTAIKNESVDSEVTMLREKNEEYRKALNVFREKLNEVAIFNSNLAYATRLFTEHSTTKKEKINILRRFDDVETLKESKNLYKSIKDELSTTESKPMNESVETKLNKNVSSGSSTTLIESKTYENPQFLRMKDLMSKIN